MNNIKLKAIKAECPWCPSDQYVPFENFDEWDMIGNEHINGDTFAKSDCTNCSNPFWIHLKHNFKIRVYRYISYNPASDSKICQKP